MAALPEDIEAQILPSLKLSILENLTQKKAVLLEFFSSAGRFRQGDLWPGTRVTFRQNGRACDLWPVELNEMVQYAVLSLNSCLFWTVTVIHRLMTHHHPMTHSYNITHEHHFYKINILRLSNILNDPPHKISSKMSNFWMYYSQIIFGCSVLPPNETPMFCT
jgi:hypothetical protein